MFQRPAIIALTEPPARWAGAVLDEARSERSSSLDEAAVLPGPYIYTGQRCAENTRSYRVEGGAGGMPVDARAGAGHAGGCDRDR
jgi:hypothetical protein